MAQPDGLLLRTLRRFSWGTSRKNMEEGARPAGITVHPTQDAFGVPAQFYDRPAFWLFYFRSGLLGSKLQRMDVNFYPNRPADPVLISDFRRIHADLQRDLGKPIREDTLDPSDPPEFRMSRMIVWRDGPSILALSLSLADDGANPKLPPIGVLHGDAKKDPMARMLAGG